VCLSAMEETTTGTGIYRQASLSQCRAIVRSMNAWRIGSSGAFAAHNNRPNQISSFVGNSLA